MTALYALADKFRGAEQAMTDLGMDEVTIRDTLEALHGEVQEKAESVAMVIRNLESLADQIEAAEKAMRDRRKSLELRADWLRAYLLANLQATGITEVQSPWFRLAVKRNPAAVKVVDESLIPTDFWRPLPPPPPAIDKKAIGEALKAGHEVPGARLDCGWRLEIK